MPSRGGAVLSIVCTTLVRRRHFGHRPSRSPSNEASQFVHRSRTPEAYPRSAPASALASVLASALALSSATSITTSSVFPTTPFTARMIP